MSNPWFRMYSEFSHDPKVQMLSEAMQRRYIMLMCLRCSDSLVTLQGEEVAFHLRISNEELIETKALFIAKGFIDSKWNLLNWEKRQFASDTSKVRVAKHRALLKEKNKEPSNADVTLQAAPCNALDKNRTDTDTEKKEEGETPRKRATPPAQPDDVAEQVWTDWLQLRKTKKAPVTKTVLTAARAEADKAGMPLERFLSVWCARGSQGLSADWLKPDERGSAQTSGETAYQRSMRERVAEFSPSIARRAPGESPLLNIIDEVLYVPSIASH